LRGRHCEWERGRWFSGLNPLPGGAGVGFYFDKTFILFDQQLNNYLVPRNVIILFYVFNYEIAFYLIYGSGVKSGIRVC